MDIAERIGGKVATLEVAGLPVDTGPDAFLARGADLRALIDDLGLGGEVVEPASAGAYIWSRGRLRPIPPGAAFGLPERLWPLLRSGLLSPLGVARAGLDIVLPASQYADDPSVADLVRPRFGDEVYHRLIEPLLGGVHAGDPARLSARSTVPEIAAIAAGGRSLYLSLRARRTANPAPTGKRPAPLVSLWGGMDRLVEALADRIGRDAIRSGVGIESLQRTSEGWRLTTDRGSFTASQLVLAVPAYAAADLLEPTDPGLSARLREIRYVGVANATLAFPRHAVPALPSGTGFLVPPVEGEVIVGCTWLTNKWPHLVNDDVVLIKCMVGRPGDDRWLTMSDARIVDEVRSGLSRMLGIGAEPFESRVQRWPRAMPQYEVGHAARMAEIDDRVAAIGDLHLTGAAYRGAGLAACVTQAAATAASLTQGVPR